MYETQTYSIHYLDAEILHSDYSMDESRLEDPYSRYKKIPIMETEYYVLKNDVKGLFIYSKDHNLLL